MKIFYCFGISIVFVYFITPLFIRVAREFNVLDHPEERKAHKEPMPLLGGAAIFLGVLVCSLLKPYIIGKGLVLLLGGAAIFFINLLDDIQGVSARKRFFVELIVTLAVIFNGVQVTFLPGGFWGNLGEIIISLVWFLGITNAFNYLDGLNGLATGSACINFFYFSLMLYLSGQARLGFLAFILLGACLGFLPHNFRGKKKARVFLGDAGSTFLGFMLAGIALLGEWAGDSIVKVCIPVLILGVPIFDMTFTTFLRIREGKVKTVVEWLKYAGKDHFHHYLIYLGLRPHMAVYFIWAITASFGLDSLILGHSNALQGFFSLCQAGMIFFAISVLIVVGRRKECGWELDEKFEAVQK